MTHLWNAYTAVLRAAEEEWQEPERPPVVTAVAAVLGMDPEALWDEVEGKRGWESHNAGYEAMVWFIAWELKSHPDWRGIVTVTQPAGASGGGQPSAAHAHNEFRCPAHAPGCGCPEREDSRCNPYRVAGYCPDDLNVMPGEETSGSQPLAGA